MNGAELASPARFRAMGTDVEVLAVGADDAAMTTLGALAATRTRLRRTWTRGDRSLHHLIDPRTGAPADTGLASVTVVAGEAWRAEVLAKAAFVAGAGEGAALLEAAGATGLLVTGDGNAVELPGLDRFRP